ncbi:polysaccharide deacetylase family protein [Chitinivibrio alkaliphilus]|uniref:Polysaccharide deacetylase n=1 Tax=Chitinivibrio alkaliphilus ACht1 TaxID=1313304 RepID=U7DAT6_9BACT|nr:polysaccharide deacetylase family protein [Chitinivibrio alkaliphilus]ERP39142.1 polysaccharide deacetylase [Chitinivibrio alkaliphilus ACht1]
MAIWYIGATSGKTPPCLLFHNIYITPPKLRTLSEISRHTFEDIITTVAAHYTITSLREYAGSTDMVLTFDDGFSSIKEHALPFLETHGHNATIFIISGALHGSSPLDIYGKRSYLSAADIREIAERGFEIGSHTMHHRDLRQLSLKECLYELEGSKKDLEDLLGMPVEALSFPLGLWNKRVLSLAKQAGYSRFSFYTGMPSRYTATPPHFAARGVYPFDSPQDVLEKLQCRPRYSQGRTRGAILPHFAKGTAMAKYHPSYAPWRIFTPQHDFRYQQNTYQ